MNEGRKIENFLNPIASLPIIDLDSNVTILFKIQKIQSSYLYFSNNPYIPPLRTSLEIDKFPWLLLKKIRQIFPCWKMEKKKKER